MMKTVILLSIIWTGVYSKDKGLKVTPPNIAVQLGQTVTLKCQHYPADLAADTELDWFMPDGTVPISQLLVNQSVINITQSDILRYKSENGTLTIVNATANDAGTYKCKKENLMEVDSIVKVYEMPEYTTEIIVVLVINAVLVVIFIICAGWNLVRERRETKILMRKHRLGHKEMPVRTVKE